MRMLNMANITFQQLEVFRIVAEQRNMTEAAKNLYISQSALSKTLRRLENSLGIQLFYRDNRGVTLTPECKYLYDSISKPMAAIEIAIDKAREISNQNLTLRLVCTSTYQFNTDYDPLKDLVSAYRRKYPAVDVQETICEWPQVQEALMFATSDVAICQEVVVAAMGEVEYERVAPIGLYLVVAENSAQAAYDTIRPELLQEEPLYILTSDKAGDIVREKALHGCQKPGFTPKQVRPVFNMLSLLQALSSGTGFFIGNKMVNTLSNVRMRYYQIDELISAEPQYIVVAWHKAKLSREALRFLNMVRRLRKE